MVRVENDGIIIEAETKNDWTTSVLITEILHPAHRTFIQIEFLINKCLCWSSYEYTLGDCWYKEIHHH